MQQHSSTVLLVDTMNLMVSSSGNNAARKRWRVVSEKNADCQLCHESGQGILIGCANEKCSQEYHLECAFHQGGLSVDDTGLLTFRCDAHFRPALFCTCKVPYDETQEMVFCDECCDWFHTACVGFNAHAAMELDTYTCASCQSLLLNGKSATKTLKDANTDKERLSMFYQRAIKVVGTLLELTGSICPVLDDVMHSREMQFSVEDVDQALQYLRLPLFNSSESVSNQDADYGRHRILQQWGVTGFVDRASQILIAYIDAIGDWWSGAKKIYFEIINTNRSSLFSIDMRILLEGYHVSLQSLDSQLTATTVCAPSDARGMRIFMIGLKWMLEFLKVSLVIIGNDNIRNKCW
jgi:hypothetical protein